MSATMLSSFDAFRKNNEASKAIGGRVLRYFLQRSLIYKMCNSVAVVVGLIVIIEQLLGNAATRKALRRIGDERLAAQGEATEALDEPFDAADLAAARSVADNALRAALAHYEAVSPAQESTEDADDTVSEQTEQTPIGQSGVQGEPPVPAETDAKRAEGGRSIEYAEKGQAAENASANISDNAETPHVSAASPQKHASGKPPSGFRFGAKSATAANGSAKSETPSTAKEPVDAS